MELKEKLKSLSEGKWILKDEDIEALCFEMVEQLGSTDPELRDDMIYRTMAELIPNDRVDEQTLKKILALSLDDRHLFYGLGETDTDSVFMRSFSVLIVALVIYADRKHAFLSTGDVRNTSKCITRYILNERDRRGYVEGKGWAHAIAHAADALDELARHQFIRDSELMDMLMAIKQQVLWAEGVYIHHEDDRLALAVAANIESGMPNEEPYIRWIESFLNDYEKQKENLDPLHISNLEGNMKNFLRSLYFRLRFEGKAIRIQESLENTLKAALNF